MEPSIPLSDLFYDQEEEEAVLRVIRSKWLTMGSVTQEFEAKFAQLLGVKYAIAVANGTVALHLAYAALGLHEGDEVIVPALTFVATANAVLYTGAQVRFADIIGPEDLNLSPQEIEKNITPRTKAVALVHYGGYPCRMVEILEIARRHGLFVIEDAAHAPGATLEGRALGTWGDVSCFSFFSNKNLAVGEGGMVVTNRDDLAEKIRMMRTHGMTTLTWDRHRGHAHSYDVVDLGYNYRIDEIRSALGLAQLHKLEKSNHRRKQITERYRAGIRSGGFDGLELPFEVFIGTPSYHIMPVLLPEFANRGAFMDSLRKAGVQTSIHYPPIHRFQYYRKIYPGISLPITEAVASREVTLPLYPSMRDEEVEYVLQAARDAFAESQNLSLSVF
jgi:dTDP-4-amino-4,6-dideoxygalactose transaminase